MTLSSDNFEMDDVETTVATPSATADNRLLYVAVGATVLGLLLLLVFAGLLITGWTPGGDNEEADNTPMPTEIAGTVLTPNAPFPTSAPAVYFDVALNPSTIISVPVDVPMQLDIAGTRFQVQADRVPINGVWQPILLNENSTAWVYGTVVNYVFGLPDSANNRALLDSLIPGDEITLINGNGSVNNFSFDQRDVVESNSSGIFAQNSPGITIALIGTAQTTLRLMAHGQYKVPEASNAGIDNQIEMGETAQLENWLVTANSSSFLYDRPEAPNGFAFFLIDYQLENISQQQLDASSINLLLNDTFGNVYALNPIAVQLGNFPLGQGVVPPGQSINATAGFQIPAGLNSGSLTFVVSVPPNPAKVEIAIPFGGAVNQASNAVVSLSGAEVSLDGTSLVLTGQVTNLGDQPLIIEESDLGLQSGGTIYLLFSTTPGFPWVVGAGQTTPFSVQFQRPAQADAVFTVLSYPFQLNGLR